MSSVQSGQRAGVGVPGDRTGVGGTLTVAGAAWRADGRAHGGGRATGRAYGAAGSGHAVDRRGMFRLAGGGVLAVAAAGALSACTEDHTPDTPDPLLAQEESARYDAAAATAAIATTPDRAGALQTIATQRTAHADALRTEIDRAIGVYGDGTTPSYRVAPVTPVITAPPSVADLRTRLTTAQRSATDLAVQLSGYRAGLLGSISAACATHAGVLLA
ncbi:hypothetical protein LTV02_02105 [Nocardia yamanashiensis]|uniref:hypothetical protein n=1 Tax=Nocardia yamanashiensis TaxID=209247 RepID=UPI001E437653|nr:hypothetical protein [Nocardia yamanashiensis]UGT42246.1 hypothetical protein LTV02_02105 [Nocardia yamanashiensis]